MQTHGFMINLGEWVESALGGFSGQRKNNCIFT